MQPTISLFESEMREQVASAEAAVLEAQRCDDPVLVDSARSHLDGLISLAERNGLDLSAPVEVIGEIRLDH